MAILRSGSALKVLSEHTFTGATSETSELHKQTRRSAPRGAWRQCKYFTPKPHPLIGWRAVLAARADWRVFRMMSQLLQTKLCKFTIKLIILKTKATNTQNSSSSSLFYPRCVLEVIYVCCIYEEKLLHNGVGDGTLTAGNWPRWEYLYRGSCPTHTSPSLVYCVVDCQGQ